MPVIPGAPKSSSEAGFGSPGLIKIVDRMTRHIHSVLVRCNHRDPPAVIGGQAGPIETELVC